MSTHWPAGVYRRMAGESRGLALVEIMAPLQVFEIIVFLRAEGPFSLEIHSPDGVH